MFWLKENCTAKGVEGVVTGEQCLCHHLRHGGKRQRPSLSQRQLTRCARPCMRQPTWRLRASSWAASTDWAVGPEGGDPCDRFARCCPSYPAAGQGGIGGTSSGGLHPLLVA